MRGRQVGLRNLSLARPVRVTRAVRNLHHERTSRIPPLPEHEHDKFVCIARPKFGGRYFQLRNPITAYALACPHATRYERTTATARPGGVSWGRSRRGKGKLRRSGVTSPAVSKTLILWSSMTSPNTAQLYCPGITRNIRMSYWHCKINPNSRVENEPLALVRNDFSTDYAIGDNYSVLKIIFSPGCFTNRC
jgi:hypothetical protein